MSGSTLRKKLLLAVAAPAIALGLLEAALRVAGFEYRKAPVDVLIGGQDPIRDATVADDDVFWTMAPDRELELGGVRASINALGLRGPLPALAKPRNAFRVVCLGDSTAFGNATSYPEQLEDILRTALPGRAVSVINAGAPGYSSWQGLTLFERDLAAYAPDLVTWCFGFNNAKAQKDGWTDAQRHAARGRWTARAADALLRLRVAQLVQKLLPWNRSIDLPFDPRRASLSSRVPPQENAALFERLAARGIRCVAITQPSAYRLERDEGRSGESGPFLAEAKRRLELQNDALRALAGRYPVCDLAREFDAIEPRDVFVDPLPGRDSIHLHAIGLRVFAERLATFLAARGLLPSLTESDGSVALDLPRFERRGGEIQGVARERGTALDDLLLVTTVDGLPRAVMLDPPALAPVPVALDLPAPDGVAALASVPAFGRELLLMAPLAAGRFVVQSLRGDGSPGRVQRTVIDLPASVPQARIAACDLAGDGRPEYALDYGPDGPNAFTLLGEDFRVSANVALEDTTCGLTISTWRGPAGEQFLIGPSRGPQSWLKHLGADLQPVLLQGFNLGLTEPGTHAIGGRLIAGTTSDDLLLVRACATFLRRPDGSLESARFPFGALREDRTAPGLALAEGGGSIWIGSRREGKVSIVRLGRDGSRARFEVALQ